MIIQLVVSLLVIGFVYIYYSYVWLTKRRMANYQKLFETAGYRVKLIPYQPFAVSSLDILFAD
jgi:hypothetical protein